MRPELRNASAMSWASEIRRRVRIGVLGPMATVVGAAGASGRGSGSPGTVRAPPQALHLAVRPAYSSGMRKGLVQVGHLKSIMGGRSVVRGEWGVWGADCIRVG